MRVESGRFPFFMELYCCCCFDNQFKKMVGERSIEREFYSFLYEVSASKLNHPLLGLAAHIIYLLQLILAYFAVAKPEHIVPTTLFTSPLLAVAVVALVGAGLVQMVVAFVYHVQAQLLLQLKVLRYILFPLTLMLLVRQLQQPLFLSPFTVALLLPLLVVIASVTNFVIHSYLECKINRTFENVSNYLVFTDVLLVVAQLPSSFLYLQAIVGCQLAMHLLLRHRLAHYNITATRQHLEYYSMLLKDFLAILYLSQRAVITGGDAVLMLLFVTPLLCGALVREVGRKRRVVLDVNIFTGRAGLNEFLESMERMKGELERFKTNQDLQLQGSLLLVFVAAHGRQCTNSGCLLLQRSTQEEIRNCNSSNNMKILKHKIIKKMESLYELYERSHLEHPTLKLHLLAFYAAHLPNKNKIALLQAALRVLPLRWQHRLVLYGLERRVEGAESGEEMGGPKGEEEFLEFKKLMVLAVGCFQEFWGQLLEERVDVRQLVSISSRLFPLKRAIENVWRRHLNREQFSSWNVLRTYTYYRRNILHDYTNSVILEDYCKIVEQRLKAKHEMNYINAATEQAVLTISLTESSLGNLSSMNNQTCKMFSFASRAEMLELRVNDIMPSVYSIVHDNILSSFLKNRFKNINQDLRFVFGKNKNGFIFPFMLQLRKLSWNLNDELIFIAHLESARLRAAPIYCIADLEGDLQDYTSTFAWLFMKKARENREIKRKNIQEMIPSFFETVEGGEVKGGEGSRVHFHERTYCHKNGHNIEIEFWASELFIKAEKVGYLIEGTNTQPLQSICDKKDINTILSTYQREDTFYCNTYNPLSLAYEIPNQSEETRTKGSRQFTIPFLRTTDIEGILRMNKKEAPAYGQKIKTLRLLHGRLEHVVEEESFRSDQDSFEKELSVIKKIEKMREQLALEQPRASADHFGRALAVASIILALLPLLALVQVPTFRRLEAQKYQNLQDRLQVRQLLPEFLIKTLYDPAGITANLRDGLKSSLMRSTIAEEQKEEILRVVFASPLLGEGKVEMGVLEWKWEDGEAFNGLLTLWYLGTAASFVYLFVLLAIYMVFRCRIAQIYTIFLSISEQKLLEMQEESKRLQEFLSAQNTEYYKVAPLQDFKRTEPEQAEFQRMKKLKDDFTVEDCTALAQLLLPAFLLFAYALTSSVLLHASFANYQADLSAWLDCAQLLPETSVSLFNSLLQPNHPLPSRFFQLEESFQFVALSGEIEYGNLLQLVQGNPCDQPLFYNSIGISTTALCANYSFDLSLANVLNYMASVLPSSNTQATDWAQMISLEFDFVKPLLGFISSSLGKSLVGVREKSQQLAVILAVAFMSLLTVTAVYVACYPLAALSERLLFTSDLVKLLPSDREREPEHALAAMTTEAMDTY